MSGRRRSSLRHCLHVLVRLTRGVVVYICREMRWSPSTWTQGFQLVTRYDLGVSSHRFV